MTANVPFVEVRIRNHGLYSYMLPHHIEVTEGDYVVVEFGGNYTVGKVDSITAPAEVIRARNVKYKWVIQKVDFTEYDRLVGLTVEGDDHA